MSKEPVEVRPTQDLLNIEEVTRRQMLFRAGAIGATLTLPGLLAACGGSSGNSGAVSTGATGKSSGATISHVTWGIKSAAPTSLDIAKSWGLPQLVSSSLALESLLTTGPDLKLRPLLARGYSQPKPTEYLFDLRPKVKFWDGSPLTAEDVVFSIERHRDPKVGSLISFFFESIAKIEAVSDTRIAIKMAQADPTMPQKLTQVPILPKKFVEEMGEHLGAPGNSVKVMGTGPYEITSFTTENGVEVKRNESYWGGKPKVESATLKYFETPQTMLLASRSGAIDGAFAFELSEADTWSNVPSVETQFLKSTGLTSFLISLDTESEPWSDLHVRRALAYCCDTAGYVKAFLANEGEPAQAIVPPAQWASVASQAEQEAIYARIPQYPFDLGKAKQELAKSGYPEGFSATLPYPNTYPQFGRALVSLSQSLKKIGVNLEVKSVTETEWLSGLFGHKKLGAQAVILGPDYNDPSDFVTQLYESSAAVENGFNVANFKNPKVDRLLRQQSETTDQKERAQMLGEVLEISGEELPYVPLWWEGPTLALSDKYVFDGFNSLYYYQAWLEYVGARA